MVLLDSHNAKLAKLACIYCEVYYAAGFRRSVFYFELREAKTPLGQKVPKTYIHIFFLSIKSIPIPIPRTIIPLRHHHPKRIIDSLMVRVSKNKIES